MKVKSNRGLTIEQELKQVLTVLDECEDAYSGEGKYDTDIEDLNNQMSHFRREFEEHFPSFCNVLDDYLTYRAILVMDIDCDYP
jgi:hypothetical protein